MARRLEDIVVTEVAFVNRPAVAKAVYYIFKRDDGAGAAIGPGLHRMVGAIKRFLIDKKVASDASQRAPRDAAEVRAAGEAQEPGKRIEGEVDKDLSKTAKGQEPEAAERGQRELHEEKGGMMEDGAAPGDAGTESRGTGPESEDVIKSMSATIEELKVQLADIAERLAVVELSKGVRKSIDGQDDAVKASVWKGLV